MTKAMWTAALAAGLLVGCGDKDDAGDSGGTADGGGDVAEGEVLYASMCAGCHGASGEGVSGTAPSMIERVPGLSEEQVTETILSGFGGMPPISASQQEAADIAAFVVVSGGPRAPGDNHQKSATRSAAPAR